MIRAQLVKLYLSKTCASLKTDCSQNNGAQLTVHCFLMGTGGRLHHNLRMVPHQ